jgi:hypothetical protein
MAMAPFGARPVSPRTERRRARLALTIASVGIGATLLAYAVSPGVRHAVSHAAHSVKHAVSRVLDHDTAKHTRAKRSLTVKHAPAPKRAATTRQPSPAPSAVPSPNGSERAPAQGGSSLPPSRTSGASTAPG